MTEGCNCGDVTVMYIDPCRSDVFALGCGQCVPDTQILSQPSPSISEAMIEADAGDLAIDLRLLATTPVNPFSGSKDLALGPGHHGANSTAINSTSTPSSLPSATMQSMPLAAETDVHQVLSDHFQQYFQEHSQLPSPPLDMKNYQQAQNQIQYDQGTIPTQGQATSCFPYYQNIQWYQPDNVQAQLGQGMLLPQQQPTNIPFQCSQRYGGQGGIIIQNVYNITNNMNGPVQSAEAPPSLFPPNM